MERLKRFGHAVVASLSSREGLDAGPLVLRIEQTFHVRIVEEDTIALRTLGDLVTLIAGKLERSGRAEPRDMLWPRVRQLVSEALGVAESELNEGIRFVEDLCF